MGNESSIYRVAAFFWAITILLVLAGFMTMETYLIISIASILMAVVIFIFGCFAALRAEFVRTQE